MSTVEHQIRERQREAAQQQVASYLHAFYDNEVVGEDLPPSFEALLLRLDRAAARSAGSQ